MKRMRVKILNSKIVECMTSRIWKLTNAQMYKIKNK